MDYRRGTPRTLRATAKAGCRGGWPCRFRRLAAGQGRCRPHVGDSAVQTTPRNRDSYGRLDAAQQILEQVMPRAERPFSFGETENSLQMAEWRLTGSHPWATIIGEASQIFPLGRRDRAIISSRAHRSRRCRSDGRGDRASRLSEHAERLTECDAIICAGSLTGGAGSIAPRGDEEFAGQPTMAMRRTLALLAPIHA